MNHCFKNSFTSSAQQKTSRERPKSALYIRLKIVKGGTLWDFLTSTVLQNNETNEGGTLWCNPKGFEKSRIVPKKSGAKGGSLVCFWGYGHLFCFFFSFWTRFWGLTVFWTSIVHVEQMNKKVELSCLKKTTHCNSRAHFLLKCAD